MMLRMACGVALAGLLVWSGCDGCVEQADDDGATSDGGRRDVVHTADAGSDAAVGDALGRDRVRTDTAVADALVEDAGQPVTVQVDIRVDELGTSSVSDVRFHFVRIDWAAFGQQPRCRDGGVADAAGHDAQRAFQSWSTDPIGAQKVFNSVGRTAQRFTVQVPETPPQSHLSWDRQNPCGVGGDVKLALYVPYAYLEGSGGSAGTFDDHDDIIGMAESVPYGTPVAEGTPMLAYAQGSAPPVGMVAGWNYIVVGMYDNAPEPEIRVLATEPFPVTISVTPHLTRTMLGSLTLPTGGAVASEPKRRVGFMVYPAGGGIEEVDLTGSAPVSVAASGTAYQDLTLPAGLNSVARYFVAYGPLIVARGAVAAYLDENADGRYLPLNNDSIVGQSDTSCPLLDVWYFREPIPWPLTIFTRARVARGYNVLGRGWDPRTHQVTPFIGIPSVGTVDIDIPADSDITFVDRNEPQADTGCACGVIPSGTGCR